MCYPRLDVAILGCYDTFVVETNPGPKEPAMSAKKSVSELVYGDLILSTQHGRYVRFLRHQGSYVVAMDRDSLKELPDYIHETQIQVA